MRALFVETIAMLTMELIKSLFNNLSNNNNNKKLCGFYHKYPIRFKSGIYDTLKTKKTG